MKKLERKVKWALTLSAMSLIIVVVIIGLWMFKSQEIAVVTLDTFIGVIVALLAIIVTLVLGWQIYNAMELKEKIKRIETLEEYIKNSHNLTTQINHSNQVGICLNTAYLWESQNIYDAAFAVYHSAFYNAIQAGISDLDSYITTLERLLPLFAQIGNRQLDMIKRDVDNIKNSDAYKLYFRERYDNIINQVLSKPICK